MANVGPFPPAGAQLATPLLDPPARTDAAAGAMLERRPRAARLVRPAASGLALLTPGWRQQAEHVATFDEGDWWGTGSNAGTDTTPPSSCTSTERSPLAARFGSSPHPRLRRPSCPVSALPSPAAPACAAPPPSPATPAYGRSRALSLPAAPPRDARQPSPARRRGSAANLQAAPDDEVATIHHARRVTIPAPQLPFAGANPAVLAQALAWGRHAQRRRDVHRSPRVAATPTGVLPLVGHMAIPELRLIAAAPVPSPRWLAGQAATRRQFVDAAGSLLAATAAGGQGNVAWVAQAQRATTLFGHAWPHRDAIGDAGAFADDAQYFVHALREVARAALRLPLAAELQLHACCDEAGAPVALELRVGPGFGGALWLPPQGAPWDELGTGNHGHDEVALALADLCDALAGHLTAVLAASAYPRAAAARAHHGQLAALLPAFARQASRLRLLAQVG